jgi:peptide/nickel transport system permease protein
VTDYFLRRLLLLALTLLGGSAVLFFAMRTLPPRDAIDLQVPPQTPNAEETKQALRRQLGLDGPLYRQYLDWLKGFFTGDWGKSLHSRRPIVQELKNRIPVSFELSLIGFFFTWALSFPLGVLCALRQDRLPDYVLRSLAYAMDALPAILIGILLLTYLAINFGWAPPTTFAYFWDDPVRHLKIMILPTVVIAVTSAGNLVRFTRTFLLEVLRQDYIRTARAKGLSEQVVLVRHALRNVALPFITVLGAAIPGLLTSSVIIENLFNLPGMGRYTFQALINLDYPVFITTTMFYAVVILTSQLVTDLTYAWADPRVSYARGTP